MQHMTLAPPPPAGRSEARWLRAREGRAPRAAAVDAGGRLDADLQAQAQAVPGEVRGPAAGRGKTAVSSWQGVPSNVLRIRRVSGWLYVLSSAFWDSVCGVLDWVSYALRSPWHYLTDSNVLGIGGLVAQHVCARFHNA